MQEQLEREKKDPNFREARRIMEQSKKDGKFFMSGLTTDQNGLLMASQQPRSLKPNQVFSRAQVQKDKKGRSMRTTMSARSMTTAASTQRNKSSADPHELMLERVMNKFTEKDKLQKLLKVDKRYNSALTSVKLDQNEIDVSVEPGVTIKQDGCTKSGGPAVTLA